MEISGLGHMLSMLCRWKFWSAHCVSSRWMIQIETSTHAHAGKCLTGQVGSTNRQQLASPGCRLVL